LWQRALDEEGSDLSNKEDMVEEERSEAKQEIAPSMIGIHDVCQSVSQSQEPVRVKPDGLFVGIID
jgi:hypothetical protein